MSDAPYTWPTGHGLLPLRHVPERPTDLKDVILRVIHFPYPNQRFQLGSMAYRINDLDFDKGLVRMRRDVDVGSGDGLLELRYYFEVPLWTWWDMTMRMALKGEQRTVQDWRVDMWADADPWSSHTVLTTGSNTVHVYEICFAGTETPVG